ncbi:MAG: hypothetical protein Q4G43_16995 [Mobilicoccus sp.]|nr:hypothetical protein [Mobilicoccus sp.]
MNRPGGKVIAFPTWRRQAMGAPGVGDARRHAGLDDTHAEARPLPSDPAPPFEDDVHWDDTPVWHEGDTPTGDVLIRMRIDIVGAKPPVWRRLEAHGNLMLDEFHHVILAAFGWPDDWYFYRDILNTRDGHRVGVAFQNTWTPTRLWPGPNEHEVRLDQGLREPGDRLRYVYQPRGIQLTIAAEEVMPMPPEDLGEVPRARCLRARRVSPPAHRLKIWQLQSRIARRGGVLVPESLAGPPVTTDGPVDLDEIDRAVRAAVPPTT